MTSHCVTCCCDAGNADSIDRSIASLAVIAQLQERDLWTVVQTMPHLFSVGGLFYQQVKRDLGLTDGKHCTLPKLPGKVRVCLYVHYTYMYSVHLCVHASVEVLHVFSVYMYTYMYIHVLVRV